MPNPKNPFPIHEAEDISPSQCNTVHILRSGKRIDNQISSHPVPNKSVSTPPVLVPPTPNDPSSSSPPSTSKSKDKTDEQSYKPIVPFPNRLANQKTNAQMEKIR